MAAAKQEKARAAAAAHPADRQQAWGSAGTEQNIETSEVSGEKRQAPWSGGFSLGAAKKKVKGLEAPKLQAEALAADAGSSFAADAESMHDEIDRLAPTAISEKAVLEAVPQIVKEAAKEPPAAQPAVRVRGVVKTFNQSKGFGFISPR